MRYTMTQHDEDEFSAFCTIALIDAGLMDKWESASTELKKEFVQLAWQIWRR
jgi:hypothetical protein